MTIGKRRNRLMGRRGGVYVLALVTLLTGVIFALSTLRAGNAYFRAQDSRCKKQAAANLAEAGIDYAYWQVHYNKCSLPYSAGVTLPTGTFSANASDDGNRDNSSMLITATATSRGHSYTARRVTLGHLPYHYAYCENRNADDGDAITSTGTGLGIRANGQINLSSAFNNVTTGVWANTTVTANGTVTPRNANCPRVAFPEIDLAYYQSVASFTYNWDVVISGFNGPGDYVVYVNGKVNVSGSYRGCWTLVTTGDITVSGNLAYSNSDSYLALVTKARIIIQGPANSVRAVMYSHKSDNSGEVSVSGITTITGVAASDDNRTGNWTTFNYDPRLNLNIMRGLRLPGL